MRLTTEVTTATTTMVIATTTATTTMTASSTTTMRTFKSWRASRKEWTQTRTAEKEKDTK